MNPALRLLDHKPSKVRSFRLAMPPLSPGDRQTALLRRVPCMTRLRGHYDGRTIILDEPIPAALPANSPVVIVIPDSREQVLREFEGFSREFWSRPLPPGIEPGGRA